MMFSPKDVASLLASYHLQSSQYTSLNGIWLFINRREFDVIYKKEPIHATLLKVNVETGIYFLKVLAETVKFGSIETIGNFEELLNLCFNEITPCFGLQKVSLQNDQLVSVTAPFRRSVSKLCKLHFQQNRSSKFQCEECEKFVEETDFKTSADFINLNFEQSDKFKVKDESELEDTFDNTSQTDQNFQDKDQTTKEDVSMDCDKLIHTKEKPYICHLCIAKFSNSHTVRGHMIASHKHNVEECEQCRRLYDGSYANVTSSAACVTNNFPCDHCHEDFSYPTSLRNHILEAHTGNLNPNLEKNRVSDIQTQKMFECMECPLKFCSKEKLIDHEKTNSSCFNKLSQHKKSKVCFFCNKIFANEQSLSCHVRNVHGEGQSLICEICSQILSSKIKLNRHLDTHARQEKGKEFQCSKCGRVFASQESLLRHLKVIHQKISKFECTFCSKKLHSRQLLDEHEAVHTGVKNRVCPDCGKSFRQSCALRMHVKLVHKKEKDFECGTCGRKFGHRSMLKKHVARWHGERNLQCSQCEKTFSGRDMLGEHTKVVHEGARKCCKLCLKTFPWMSTFTKHLKTEHKIFSVKDMYTIITESSHNPSQLRNGK